MTWTLRTLVLAGVVSAQSLGAHAARAQELDDGSAIVAVTDAQMKDFVRGEIETYFRGIDPLTSPTIQTETRTTFREVEGKPALAEIEVNVTLTTDQPSQVVREARQTLARALLDQGYRFETLDNVVDPRPLAILKVTTAEPAPQILKRSGTKEYLTFGAIVLGLLASLVLFFSLLSRPFRRKRPAARAYQRPDQQAPRQDPSPFASALPEFPSVGEFELPPLSSTAARVDPSLGFERAPPKLDPETEALRQLPFEKVLDLLIAAEPGTRRSIIARLDLNPPLRRRLEKQFQ